MLLYFSLGYDERGLDFEGDDYFSLISLVAEEFELEPESFTVKELNEDGFFDIENGFSFTIERSERHKALERLNRRTSFKYVTDIREIEDILLVHGFLIDEEGETPLHRAVWEGNLEIVEVILGKNFNNVHDANNNGETPLFWAAHNGHIEIVGAILEKNFDNVHKAANDGGTPIYHAAYNGHLEIVKVLLGKNFNNVHQASNCGKTPLYWAVSNGHLEIYELLKQHKTK